MPHPTASFLFMDESGVLQSRQTQPFFAVGTLWLPRPESLHRRLLDVRARAAFDLGIPGRQFEFKLNRVTKRTLPFFREAMRETLLAIEASVVVTVLKKSEHPMLLEATTQQRWSIYCACARQAVGNHVARVSGTAIVLADYLDCPRAASASLEEELRQVPGILNVLLLESDSSLLIQAVDLLVGGILFDFRRREACPPSDLVKLELVEILLQELGIPQFEMSLALNRPCKLQIQPYTME